MAAQWNRLFSLFIQQCDSQSLNWVGFSTNCWNQVFFEPQLFEYCNEKLSRFINSIFRRFITRGLRFSGWFIQMLCSSFLFWLHFRKYQTLWENSNNVCSTSSWFKWLLFNLFCQTWILWRGELNVIWFYFTVLYMVFVTGVFPILFYVYQISLSLKAIDWNLTLGTLVAIFAVISIS